MIDPNLYASKVDEVERLSKELHLANLQIDDLKKKLAEATGPLTCEHDPKQAGGACGYCHVGALEALDTIEKTTRKDGDGFTMSLNSIARHGLKMGGGLPQSIRLVRELCGPYSSVDLAKKRFETMAAELKEKDRLIGELREIVDLAVDLGGVSFHEESCPQDDTCFCVDVKRVNEAMGPDFKSKRRAGSINLPTTEKRVDPQQKCGEVSPISKAVCDLKPGHKVCTCGSDEMHHGIRPDGMGGTHWT